MCEVAKDKITKKKEGRCSQCLDTLQDLATAMKKLGLNPTETEIQDLINEVEMNGYIYYPEFCQIMMRKMREDDEENFHQELYRTFVGPKWTPTEPANLYNVHKEFLTFEQFKMVMTNLPDYVSESQAEEIFRIADRDGNGYISYTEFKASGSTDFLTSCVPCQSEFFHFNHLAYFCPVQSRSRE